MVFGLMEWVLVALIVLFFGGWGIKKLISSAKEVREELKNFNVDNEPNKKITDYNLCLIKNTKDDLLFIIRFQKM
jgi:hypothetical protein